MENKPNILSTKVLSNGKILPLYDTVDVAYLVDDLGKEVDACKQIVDMDKCPRLIKESAQDFLNTFEPGLDGYKDYLDEINNGLIEGYKF